jgi:hypothetical protein
VRLEGYDQLNFAITPALKVKAESLKHLLQRYGRAMNSREIEEQVQISGVQVRAIVSHLRVVERQPIGSDQRGYFWARSREELKTTIEHMKQRGIKDLTVASALEKIFPPPEQERLL